MDCPTMESAIVPIEKLIRDERLRFRVPHSHLGPDAEEQTIERYREAFSDYGGWGLFPAITIVELSEPHEFDAVQTERDQRVGVKRKRCKYPAGSQILVGGFTRCMAATLAGVLESSANIVRGTWDDAVKMAWQENARHDGRKRTSEELRDVIRSIESAHPDLSEHAVAKLAGCNRSAVWRARQAKKTFQESISPEDSDSPADAMRSKTRQAGQESDVVRDLWGRPLLTNQLREQFNCVPSVLERKKRISSLIAEIAKLKQGPSGTEKCFEPGMVFVDVGSAMLTIMEALDGVTDCIPWIVCPQCDANDAACEMCNSRGWITKRQAEDLPPNLEKKARKWMADRTGE
jgi:hypothetical protein